MDCDDIDFDKELEKFYLPCLNSNYVRKDRIIGFCDYHKCYVSKNQEKNRKCRKIKCKYLNINF